jgi:nucleolar protein 56
VNIETFARRVISLAEYRHKLHTYLLDKMHVVAPNLSALIGEVVGARLISHAGSLTNLAKYPASTVQILGAEKALFRALKTKGNTPKYGLIFHSSFIGRAKQRNKGRISRYLANKCSIASRIDCFSELATDAFGAKMKEQVEERLRFYEDGIAPKKNITAMQEAIQSLAGTTDMDLDDAEEPKSKKKKKKDKDADATEAADVAVPAEQNDADQPKTDKKKKKKKRTAADEAIEAAVTTAEQPTKKKKKKAKDTEA